jgi:hypothetical protein
MRSLSSQLRPIAGHLTAAPRVYADANLPWGVVDFMRQTLGWDVLFVLEDPDLRRASDRDHFRWALEFGRTIVTLDHDFLDGERFPPADSPGVVVCTAPGEDGLRRLLKELDERLPRGVTGDPPLRGQVLDWHLGHAAGAVEG